MAGSYSDFDLMTIKITDTTSREDLIALVNDLDAERKEMHDGWRDSSDKEEELQEQVQAMKPRLAEAADILANLGRIHNTPHAKAQWAEGA